MEIPQEEMPKWRSRNTFVHTLHKLYILSSPPTVNRYISGMSWHPVRTPPPNPVIGDSFFDDTTDKSYIYNGCYYRYLT
jgi:hypothetical protein